MKIPKIVACFPAVSFRGATVTEAAATALGRDTTPRLVPIVFAGGEPLRGIRASRGSRSGLLRYRRFLDIGDPP
jgi:hypothetical protein